MSAKFNIQDILNYISSNPNQDEKRKQVSVSLSSWLEKESQITWAQLSTLVGSIGGTALQCLNEICSAIVGK